MPESTPYSSLGSQIVEADADSGYDLTEIFKNRYYTIKELKDYLPPGIQLPGQERIKCSTNVVFSVKQGKNAWAKQMLGSPEHGRYQLAGRYLLVLFNGKETEYVLVSHEDAGLIKKGLYDDKKKVDPLQYVALCTLDGEVSAASRSNAPPEIDANAQQKALASAALLCGKAHYSSKVLKQLQEAIKDSPEPQKAKMQLQAFYESILQYMPAAAKSYRGSDLQKWFTSQAPESIQVA